MDRRLTEHEVMIEFAVKKGCRPTSLIHTLDCQKLALCSQDNNLTELVLNLFGQRPESNGNGPGPQSQAGQPAENAMKLKPSLD